MYTSTFCSLLFPMLLFFMEHKSRNYDDEQQFMVTKSVKLQKGNTINIEVSWNIIFSIKEILHLKLIAIGSCVSYMTAYRVLKDMRVSKLQNFIFGWIIPFTPRYRQISPNGSTSNQGTPLHFQSQASLMSKRFLCLHVKDCWLLQSVVLSRLKLHWYYRFKDPFLWLNTTQST